MSERNDGSRYPVVECLIPFEDLEWVSAELYDLGTIGIEELAASGLTSPRVAASKVAIGGFPEMLGLRAGFPSEAMAHTAATYLLQGEDERAVPWQPQVEIIIGNDWLDAWREHFAPLRAGRIVVAPAWKQHDGSLAEDPILQTLSAQDIVLWLEPGRAWGTGAHASTALCLSALQRLLNAGTTEGTGVTGIEDTNVLDVGCGSGVLGVAALLLGAASAYGIDIDESSPGVTDENARRNGVSDRCTSSTEPIGEVKGSYELVLANILAPVLIGLASQIAARVTPGGALVLAGLIEDQRERVLAAYPTFGVEHTEHQGEWVGLTLRRPQG